MTILTTTTTTTPPLSFPSPFPFSPTSDPSKPLLLVTSFEFEGHFNPTLAIASHLAQHRGYRIVFQSVPAHEARIRAAGCAFLPATPMSEMDPQLYARFGASEARRKAAVAREKGKRRGIKGWEDLDGDKGDGEKGELGILEGGEGREGNQQRDDGEKQGQGDDDHENDMPDDAEEESRILASLPAVRHLYENTAIVYSQVGERARELGQALAFLRAEMQYKQQQEQNQQIIILHELGSMATAPYKCGASPPSGFEEVGFPRCVGLAPFPLCVRSSTGETAPFPFAMGFSPLPPSLSSRSTSPLKDEQEEGEPRNSLLEKKRRARNLRLARKLEQRPWYQRLFRMLDGILLGEMGCDERLVAAVDGRNRGGERRGERGGGARDFFALMYGVTDVALQLCSPSLEYPLSGGDIPATVRFAGCLPPMLSGGGAADSRWEVPDWWGDVLAVSRAREEAATGISTRPRRKMIFVSQGTVNLDYSQLIIPTLRAFAADRDDDILVVAALGKRGASLSSAPTTTAAAAAASYDDDGRLTPAESSPPCPAWPPRNARVADYIPYDLALAHADVFVSNAGYGSLCHAAAHGVPSCFAGGLLDKKEVTMRAVNAGFAVALPGEPSPDEVRRAVEEVLGWAGEEQDGDEVGDGGRGDRREEQEEGRRRGRKKTTMMSYRERAQELRMENERLDCLGAVERAIVEFTE